MKNTYIKTVRHLIIKFFKKIFSFSSIRIDHHSHMDGAARKGHMWQRRMRREWREGCWRWACELPKIPGLVIKKKSLRTLTTPNAHKAVEQQELSFIAGGNTKWNNLFRGQFGGFLQNLIYPSHRIQPSFSLVFTERSLKLMTTQKLAHGCL